MAPQVKKAKTAFLYFQGDKLAAVKNEMNLSMGDAMTEVRLDICFIFSWHVLHFSTHNKLPSSNSYN
jgi:hypothetical protein